MRPLRLAPLSLLMVGLVGPAWGVDLHQIWDQQCGGCHGHAGQFVRDNLQVVDGELRGQRSERDVTAFLRTHNGGYSPETIAAVVGMMKAQASTPELFKARCGECHETAAQLVRDQVVERDGRLVGLGSGRPLEEFLPGHSKLSADELAQMTNVLQRVYSEVHHKP